jgi:two-component system cell cycle response regulator DivK
MENLLKQNTHKVLIVEDEESNYELLKAFLRNFRFEIIWAKNGIDALELFNHYRFDLVLMDIKMPEMNGYEAVEKIRAKGIKVPIIAQTAYARIEDESLILNRGFDGYISKPIDKSKLTELVRKFLNI